MMLLTPTTSEFDSGGRRGARERARPSKWAVSVARCVRVWKGDRRGRRSEQGGHITSPDLDIFLQSWGNCPEDPTSNCKILIAHKFTEPSINESKAGRTSLSPLHSTHTHAGMEVASVRRSTRSPSVRAELEGTPPFLITKRTADPGWKLELALLP